MQEQSPGTQKRFSPNLLLHLLASTELSNQTPNPVFWANGGEMGIMEKQMETTKMGYIGIIGYMGSCQNHGPFLDPYENTSPNI